MKNIRWSKELFADLMCIPRRKGGIVSLKNNLAGRRFGRLSVLYRTSYTAGRVKWLGVCDCGRFTTTDSGDLLRGNKNSCGCLLIEESSRRMTTHGHSKGGKRTTEFVIWCDMNQRCRDENSINYKNYGGRGISICKRWEKFKNFYTDMGNRPEGKTLDRKENDGNYEPKNCRWVTPKEQSNNRRGNVIIDYGGKSQTVAQWSEELGIKHSTLHKRLFKYGWSIKRSIETPLNEYFSSLSKQDSTI